jgi:hypothetical protein
LEQLRSVDALANTKFRCGSVKVAPYTDIIVSRDIN